MYRSSGNGGDSDDVCVLCVADRQCAFPVSDVGTHIRAYAEKYYFLPLRSRISRVFKHQRVIERKKGNIRRKKKLMRRKYDRANCRGGDLTLKPCHFPLNNCPREESVSHLFSREFFARPSCSRSFPTPCILIQGG